MRLSLSEINMQICDGCKSLATNKKLPGLLEKMAVSVKAGCNFVWMSHWQLNKGTRLAKFDLTGFLCCAALWLNADPEPAAR